MELHLNPLKNKVVGELVFKCVSQIHIGAGGVEARRTFLRLLNGSLLIPSSTWKGAFRSVAEKVAKNLTFNGLAGIALKLYREGPRGISYSGKGEPFTLVLNDLVNALRGSAAPLIDQPQQIEHVLLELGYGEDELEELKKHGTEAGGARQMAEDYIALHCPLGKLFGNRVLAAKLRFFDTIIASPRTQQKPGIGMDRRTGKVVEGNIYFLEVLPPGEELKLRIVADNLLPKAEDTAVLASTLDIIREIGLHLGGRKSVGLGELTLDEEASKFYLVKLNMDKEAKLLANPFKYAQTKRLEDFLHWLRTGTTT